MATDSDIALLATVACHAGFQLTVTVLVYPVLFRASDWDSAHAAHSRAITPLVALVYGAVVATSAWVVVDGMEHAATWIALTGVAVSLAATAFRAAPLHGRLAAGRDDSLVESLRRADLVRLVGALIAFGGALFAAL